MRLVPTKPIVLIVFACVALFASSAHADATSTIPASGVGASELKREILAEKVRVAQLKKSLQPKPGIAHTLRKGSSGKDVQLLQDFLKLYGTFATTTPSSGYFGVQTARAVQTFQRKELIDPVGIVGPKTRVRILALSAHEISMQEKARVASSSEMLAPQITSVIFSSDVGEDGSGVGSSTVFASTTKNIYAILTLTNAQQDTAVGFVRYYNGAYVDSAMTHPSRTGLRYLHVQWSLKTDANRTPGTYMVAWYVDGKKSKTAEFTVN